MFQCYDPHAFLRGEPELNKDAAGSAPPDAFGPFRVLHQIGAGALGPVFRAYHPEQDRLVAVKMFRLDLPPERVHQFVAELERLIAADLSHPGIAAPLAAGIADVWAYLAQDFVAADSLDIVVRDSGPAAPRDVVRFATQLAGALDLAAAIDVTHGTLHPRDLLMSPDDVRITGLGITRALEKVGVAAPFRRPYTAPERTAGGAWDRRADVFSLAALAFELLSGRRISGPGEPAIESLSRQNASVRDALRRVFSHALEEDPKDRFSNAGDFAGALQEAFEPPAKSVGRALVSSRRPVAPVEVDEPDEMPVFAPLPVEKLPLLTDEMLTSGEESSAVAVPAEDLGPPPIADALASLADQRIVREEPPLPIELPGVERDLDPPWSPDTFRADVAARAPHLDVKVHEVGARQIDGPSVGVDAPSFGHQASVPARSTEVWPLILALVVGIALGFGSAMLLLGRDRSSGAQTASAAPQARPAPVVVDEPPIHEITEGTFATASKPPVAATAANASVPPSGGVAVKAPVEPSKTAPAKPVVPKPVLAKPAAAKPATAKPVSAKPAPPPTAAQTRERIPARSAPVQAPTREMKSEAKSGPGSLLVESRPVGASVFVDGKLIGKTPLTTEGVGAGDHAIYLDLPGYKRWAASVRITTGERSRVAASLDK